MSTITTKQKSPRNFALAAAAVVLLMLIVLAMPLLLGGSGNGMGASASLPTFDASELKCETIATSLKDAKAELKEAKATLKKDKNVLNELAVKNATNKADAITARSGECERDGLSTTGVEEGDGTVRQLPIYTGTDQPVVFDSTTDPVTPALLDGSLRYQNQTHSWADLVKRAANQPGYIDGLNARAAFTGFDWSDVLEFAKVDKTDTDIETRVIQVFNLPGISDADVREQVRPYMGAVADSLQIMRIDSSFVNTINVGTKEHLKMGDYVDSQKMVRVALVPIIFNEKGEATQLDGSKGAGVFIDCGNLHWVPKQVYKCTDSSCAPPPPATPPTPGCTVNCGPPPGCTVNCTPPPCVTNCPKNWEASPTKPNGVTPLPSGPLEVRPSAPASPAPVLPPAQTPSSGTQAPGATEPVPDRPIPAPATGTTPGGGTGSVNPAPTPGSTEPPVNTTDPGNPFG